MFPNDDICNIRAAKSAARRIFQKYSVTAEKQQSSKGLGQEQVSGLIKNAYNAINIPYDPSINDVSSFMSVFGVGQNGRIQLDKLEQLAVKYLCGQEAFKEDKNFLQLNAKEKVNEFLNGNSLSSKTKNQKQTVDSTNNSKQKTSIKNDTKKLPEQPVQHSNIQSTNQINQRNFSSKFLSPKVTTDHKNYFSSKQNLKSQLKNSKTQEHHSNTKLTYSQILNCANQIFNQHKNRQKLGITMKQAPDVLSKTYRLMGKNKFSPIEQDVKIWMKLCDTKKNGVVDWISYQNFVKRLMERQNILESHLN